MSIAKNTYRVFFYTLLLAVYSSFFSVQFFFNFEGFSHSTAKVAVAKKAPAHSSSGPSFRLNKRFQQEDMPPCEVTSVVAPLRYTTLPEPGFYPDAPLSSGAPLDLSLRGPPPAAC